MIQIATLITCHNRKANTLACLEALFQNILPDECCLHVFLVDDGCTDGTSQAVYDRYPQVNIISGTGNLFWNGGMRLAWQTALNSGGFDYYLWLNDDTLLKPSAISELLITVKEYFGIIVGSCHSPQDDGWTYGGRTSVDGKKSLYATPVLPGSTVQICQQMNGNVVLVPSAVVERIGILSDKFTHAIGDFDFGFRALDAGISLFIPANYQATCPLNPIPDWCNTTTPILKRLALLNSPKGIDIVEFVRFCYGHFGFMAILVGAKILLRVFFPRFWINKNLEAFTRNS